MNFLGVFPQSLRIAAASALLLLANTGHSVPDRKFETSRSLQEETRTFVNLLEEIHFNRDHIPQDLYSILIKDYMADLDGQHLFFLQSDLKGFGERYTPTGLAWTLRSTGRLNAAFDIYSTYETRVETRANWIFEELKKDFDFSVPESYVMDRSKSEWPRDEAEAADLWRRRLKFELLSDLLNKKDINEAKDNVRKRYERMLKNLGEIEVGDVAEIFLTSLSKIYDPHSTYFSAESYEDFSIQMRLSLVGIGAVLSVENDYCTVKEIVPGGPADLNGQLRPNDKILSVTQEGGEPVDIIGMKLRKTVNLIRGNKGSKVKLLVQPANATDSSVRREIVIERDVVKLNSARAFATIHQVPGPDGLSTVPIGVITLPSFYGMSEDEESGEKTSATKDVSELISRLKKSNIKGLVLDLRQNGGGLLSEAIDLTGLFIKDGPVVQVKAYSGEVVVDSDTNESIAYDGPLAVLVSRFSASASEIVAGALQNYGRAILIGDSSTHGKGSVQNVIEMKNISPLLSRSPAKTGAGKFTIQKFYLPSGASTQNKGVVPDITLPSIDDLLPIGESDLPYALPWDEVPGTKFAGKPIDSETLKPLINASRERQEKLEEFAFLRRSIAWFKTRVDEKSVSLNMDERKKLKESDDAFKKEMDATRDTLAKANFPSEEILLAPRPPKPIKAAPTGGSDDPLVMSTDEEETAKFDVHLRESLRILADALPTPEKAITAAPTAITAQADAKSS